MGNTLENPSGNSNPQTPRRRGAPAQETVAPTADVPVLIRLPDLSGQTIPAPPLEAAPETDPAPGDESSVAAGKSAGAKSASSSISESKRDRSRQRSRRRQEMQSQAKTKGETSMVAKVAIGGGIVFVILICAMVFWRDDESSPLEDDYLKHVNSQTAPYDQSGGEFAATPIGDEASSARIAQRPEPLATQSRTAYAPLTKAAGASSSAGASQVENAVFGGADTLEPTPPQKFVAPHSAHGGETTATAGARIPSDPTNGPTLYGRTAPNEQYQPRPEYSQPQQGTPWQPSQTHQESQAGQGYRPPQEDQTWQGDPSQANETQGYQTQGYPTQGYQTQGYPTQGYQTQANPTQGYPTQRYPTQGYPTQGYQTPAPAYTPPAYTPPAYTPPRTTNPPAYTSPTDYNSPSAQPTYNSPAGANSGPANLDGGAWTPDSGQNQHTTSPVTVTNPHYPPTNQFRRGGDQYEQLEKF